MGAFGEDVLPTLLNSVNCSGWENELLDCSFDSTIFCGTYSDAGVICQGTFYCIVLRIAFFNFVHQ